MLSNAAQQDADRTPWSRRACGATTRGIMKLDGYRHGCCMAPGRGAIC